MPGASCKSGHWEQGGRTLMHSDLLRQIAGIRDRWDG